MNMKKKEKKKKNTENKKEKEGELLFKQFISTTKAIRRGILRSDQVFSNTLLN